MARVVKDQDSAVYLALHDSFDPFVWGGGCMRREEGTEELGGFTPTTQQNPRGGLIRDGVMEDPPGLWSGTLAMKRLAGDARKSELKYCYWDVDLRYFCEGKNLDAWNEWDEISRACRAKASNRKMSGSSFSEEDAEAMVSFDLNALYEEDIYRVYAEELVCAAP